MKGRLLDLTLEGPYENLAFEEALLRKAEVPTLRIWENQESVVIGRAQLARFETDIDYCKGHAIPVVRRVTAGGAVYNGHGNLNWTFFIPAGDEPGWLRRASGATGVFASFASVLVDSLTACGVECRFERPNRIVCAQGKISGMAAYVSRNAVLCHGTLLVRADLAEVQRLTRPKEEALLGRYPRSMFTAVANCSVEKERFVARLSETLPGFEPGERTTAEGELCSSLLPKYRSDDWNLGDPFELDYL